MFRGIYGWRDSTTFSSLPTDSARIELQYQLVAPSEVVWMAANWQVRRWL